MKKWFVLYTKPNQEIKVVEQLKEMGISCYCPTVTIIKQYSDRKKKILSHFCHLMYLYLLKKKIVMMFFQFLV